MSGLGESQNGEKGVPKVRLLRINVVNVLSLGLYPMVLDIVDSS